MLTRQIGRLQELNSEMGSNVMATLAAVMGNCAQSLEHRGDVSINVDGYPNGLTVPIVPFTEENAYSAFTAQNANSQVIDPVQNQVIHNGLAGLFLGVVNIIPNRRLGLGLIVNGGIWADRYYANGYYDQSGNEFWATSGRWAVAQSDSVTGSPDQVTVKFCDDAQGVGVGGIDVTVILPERAGVDHRVSLGDVIAVGRAQDGTYFCLSDYSGDLDTPQLSAYDHNGSLVGTRPELNFVDTSSVTFTVTDDGGNNRVNVSATAPGLPIGFGIAQHNWVRNSSGVPYVELRACNYDGSSITGSAFNAYFDRVYGGGFRTRDPNVTKDSVVMFATINSRVSIIDPSAWDDAIGTVKQYVLATSALGTGANATTPKSGWGKMNSDGAGTGGNDTAEGGCGISMDDKFMRGQESNTASPNTIFGSPTYLEELYISVYPALADIGVADHDDHVHELNFSSCGPVGVAAGSDYTINYLASAIVGSTNMTGGVRTATYPHPATELSHVISQLPHAHFATASPITTSLPLHQVMHWIERLDNSFEITGI